MTAFWTSVVAVAGTLLGSLITHIFQRHAAQRGERFARAEALRQERIAAFCAFAGAVEDYRHAQATRWHRGQDHPDSEAYVTARDEAHRLRTAARQALYRVKLLCEDPEVIRAADRAYRHTWEISTARTGAEHDARDERARRSVESFVSGAAVLVR